MKSFGKHLFVGVAAAAFLTSPALAGEEVLYQPAAAWVVTPQLPQDAAAEGGIFLLADQQIRFEPGKTLTFGDMAYRITSPEMMTQLGTLQLSWLPDKGDLIVHRIELVRDGEVIDLLKQGARFEVIRREQGLEQRLMTGALTAAVALPGVRVGDIVRLSATTTLSDQVLGDEVQMADLLPSKNAMLRGGRISVSWPAEMPVQLKTVRTEAQGALIERNGYKVWSLDLPLAEPAEVPSDAPLRYQMPPMVQAGSFSGWQEVSAINAPHYATDGRIAPSGTLRDAIDLITERNSSQMDRAAAALVLVQDEISYLMNGMNGGNYLPQSPADTWQQRFGDCKAKTLLLLSMLREMGIESEAVLVRTQGGDALPQLLPLPLQFDHVIVRAVIDGKDYWLDGTGSGASRAGLEEVPRFFWALPIRDGGAELIPLRERAQTLPDSVARVTLDQRAGIRVPALFEAEFELSGAAGAAYRLANSQLDKDMRDQMVQAVVASHLGDAQIVEHSIGYDDARRIALVSAKGLITSPWAKERDRYELTPPVQAAANVGFDADRGRSAWRDIPLRLNGPIFQQTELTVLLPKESGDFTLAGKPAVDAVIGGVALKSHAALSGGTVTVTQAMQSLQTELPAEQIAPAKRELAGFLRDLPTVRAPEQVRENDDYGGRQRATLKPIEDMYARLIAEADEDDLTPYANRMRFYYGIRDYAAALKDNDRIIAEQPDAATYVTRGEVLTRLGRLDDALAAYREAEELEANGDTYWAQLELLGMMGRTGEMQTLVDDYRDVAGERHHADMLAAQALGWQGQYDEGLSVLQAALDGRPGDPDLLNQICWFGAIWNRVDDSILTTCDQAVTKSDYSGQALDSRGVAYLRAGRVDDALADFSAALSNGKDVNNARYMRGLVKLQQDDASGRADVERALHVDPSLAKLYSKWGFAAPE